MRVKSRIDRPAVGVYSKVTSSIPVSLGRISSLASTSFRLMVAGVRRLYRLGVCPKFCSRNTGNALRGAYCDLYHNVGTPVLQPVEDNPLIL